MSERRLLSQEEVAERDTLLAQRKAELAPLLARLADLGTSVYEQLRPRAQHVSTVERDFPLRHQQVYGLGVGGPEGVVADYLMIAFGGNHDLTVYRDYDRDRSPLRLDRAFVPDQSSLTQERTVVKEVPRRYYSIEGTHSIEVSRYTHKERIGLNPLHDEFLCIWPEYQNAETYIEAFQHDLTRTLEEHS
ncbi:MAG TPA: hypothetical protein VLE69_02125 [Candidatus Saccharimonadales bacterium]|nr:hypothetical protein [Candidatus Saccharimonadales bacterium]